jgi:phage host-nuclease inhibitor protein Gam
VARAAHGLSERKREGGGVKVSNWDECNEALRRIALIDLTVKRAAAAKEASMLATENRFKEATQEPIATRAELEGFVEAFARAHRKEIEAGGRKSLALNFGAVGFRMSKPKLALRKGVKWPEVVTAIKAKFAALASHLISTKEEPNKEGIKACLTNEQMAEVGVSLKQAEEFFIETFPERVETRS